MKALLDTNIVLDYLLSRQPFDIAAKKIWQASIDGRFVGCISAITPVNVYYISRKVVEPLKLRALVADLLNIFEVCPLDSASLQAALKLPLNDYEDAAQCASALAAKVDVIVTRDPKDFAASPIPALAPDAFLARLTV